MASDSYRIVNNGNDSLVAFGADVPLEGFKHCWKRRTGSISAVEVVGTGNRPLQLVNVTLTPSLPRTNPRC